MSKRRLSYDSNCRDLADHFLAETVCTDADREDLAQDIQDAVESWMLDWERKNVPAEPKAQPTEPRRDANGDIIPWPKDADYFMAFDPENPDLPMD